MISFIKIKGFRIIKMFFNKLILGLSFMFNRSVFLPFAILCSLVSSFLFSDISHEGSFSKEDQGNLTRKI